MQAAAFRAGRVAGLVGTRPQWGTTRRVCPRPYRAGAGPAAAADDNPAPTLATRQGQVSQQTPEQ